MHSFPIADMNRRHFLALTSALFATACTGMGPAAPNPQRAGVDRFLARLERDLRADRWSRLEWAFSPDFRELPSVRNRWETRWTRRDTMDVQLIPGRVLESNGLLNVAVRWNRSVRDRTAQIHKSSGNAELILEPFEGEFRIRQVLGESFF